MDTKIGTRRAIPALGWPFLCAEIISSAPEVQAATKPRIYPNPANYFFTIGLAEPSIGSQWQLTDALGRTVRAGMLAPGVLAFNVAVGNLPPGIYCLKIEIEASKILLD
ncbi:MAG: T9SS type A sorting domain-containing protein [Saprospiraceae bacterium]|nr:T9SS type A sorting domain-containing protein [Saprospiraceae bacterium]